MHLGAHAQIRPDKIAVHRPSTGERLTYRQLDDRSNQLARFLHAQGLGPGDHVALYCENRLEFVEVLQACMRAGLYLTPINRHLPAAEAAYIVDDCDAKALIASQALPDSAELGRLAERPAVRLAIGGALEGFEDYDVSLASQVAARPADERLGSLMLYSSGTTGRPKGVLRPLPDRRPADPVPAGMGGYAELYGMDPDTVLLCTAPLYHGAPIGFASAVIQAGGTLVVMDKFDAALALELIERFRVTHSQWVPTMFVRLLKLGPKERARWDLSSHLYAIHAAAPCPIEVKRQMIDWWGPIIEEFYAATESVGRAMIGSHDWLAHPGSVGRAVGRPFHICNEAGDELPAGEPGLIYAESNLDTPFHYHKDEGKTAAARHPKNGAWMTVGDIGYLDEEGFLYLTDRKAFMIISGGVNIYPQQIEGALALHPKVADVAVIGVPNQDLGEEVKAVVEPAPGATPSVALAQEIIDFVREKLGRQLAPRSVDFTDALPRQPNGKLYKKVLRDKYWGPKMTYEFCKVERDGRLTIVTINRPEVMNALHMEAHLELQGVWDAFEADPDQWVAIVTGAGDRAFSAGRDLKAGMKNPIRPGGLAAPKVGAGFAGLTSRFGMNKPVIAAVNGVALGGGFELALACDIIIAAENAAFALPEVRVGLAALGSGLLRLPKIIGEKRAMSLILTGRRVSAAEGLALGFVTEVAPDGQALDVAKRWAAQILEASPLSVRASKEVVRLTRQMPIEEAQTAQMSFPAMVEMLNSEDAKEGPKAFAEKRTPAWKGK
jgi:fatty-acyl-CoA synthase